MTLNIRFFVTSVQIFLPFFLWAQNDSAALRMRALKKGDNCISIYYGTNTLRYIFKTGIGSEYSDLKVSSIGPVGLVYEHMVSDRRGIGAELGYSETVMDYQKQLASGTPGTLPYNYRLESSTLRVMLRMNFHFLYSQKIDAYWLLAVGFRGVVFNYYTNDKGTLVEATPLALFPIGIKGGIGMKYFFTRNVGLNLELALGTPVLCGGLAVKF